MRRNNLRVSRKMRLREVKEVFENVEDATSSVFKASRGWLENFRKSSSLSVGRRTTVAQKSPNMMLEKMVSFIRFMERTRERKKAQPLEIYAVDETAVWLDMLRETTVDVKGRKSVCVKITGHEKSRFTVILTASAAGSKLKPYVVFFGGSRKVKELNETKRLSGTIAHHQ